MEERKGRYGAYGGQYIPETLIPAVQELEQEYEKYKNDPAFQQELKDLMESTQADLRFCTMQKK